MLFDIGTRLATLVLHVRYAPHINVANKGVHGGLEYKVFVFQRVK